MIADVLPAEISASDARGPLPEARMLPVESDELGAVSQERYEQFTTGRTLARRALDGLGVESGPILRGDHGRPVWPDGVVGSITHCSGYVAAAVGRSTDITSLGIDAEAHDSLSALLRKRITVESERKWLAEAPSGTSWDRVLFSAKESVYKAWYPISGVSGGFQDVEVAMDVATGTFRAWILVSAPVVNGRPFDRFEGRFAVRDGLILTAAVAPA